LLHLPKISVAAMPFGLFALKLNNADNERSQEIFSSFAEGKLWYCNKFGISLYSDDRIPTN